MQKFQESLFARRKKKKISQFVHIWIDINTVVNNLVRFFKTHINFRKLRSKYFIKLTDKYICKSKSNLYIWMKFTTININCI